MILHRTKTCVFVLLILFLLSGCIPDIKIPKDKYLFVEYWIQELGTGTCTAKYIDGPLYSKDAIDDSMGLHSCSEKPPYFSGEFDLSGRAEITDNITVLLGMGRQYCGENWFGVYSVMYPLEKLPYAILESDIGKTPFGISANTEVTISEMIDDVGTISIKVDDESSVLEPYQSWVYSFEDNPEITCKRTVVYSFTNYGLIEKKRVRLSP